MSRKRGELTEQQMMFCDEYLVDLNITRAYKAAYPNIKSDPSAAVCGSKLLKTAKVKAYIDEKMQRRAERVEISQDRVIQELAAIAFANTTDLVEIKKGVVKIKDTDELTVAQKRAVATIKEGRDGVEVKMHDKQRALELLGKHLGMFRERVEVSGLEAEKSKLAAIISQMREEE